MNSIWFYRLWVIVRPRFWLNSETVNRHWDAWLIRQLAGHAEIEILSEYRCAIAGVEVWIANTGYASGRPGSLGEHYSFGCSKATRLWLFNRTRGPRKAFLRKRKEAQERAALEDLGVVVRSVDGRRQAYRSESPKGAT